MGLTEQNRVNSTALKTFDLSDRGELGFIERICKRSNFFVEPHNETLSDKSQLPSTIKIVSISQTIPEDYLQEKAVTKNQTEYVLYPLKPQYINKVKNNLINSIDHACNNSKAHFIVTNELGYPITKLSQNYSSDKRDLEKNFRKLSKSSNSYLITGSHHCLKTCLNIAALFYPDKKRKGKKNPFLHAKKTSAHLMGEKVILPYTKQIRIYQTQFGRIGILICLDSFDPTIVIGLTRALHNPDPDKKKPAADIIFVPSYSDKHKESVKAARDLSFLLANIVVLTNEYDSGGGVLNTVYMCGETVQGNLTKRNTNNILYKISRDKYLKKRKEILDLRRTSDSILTDILGVPKKASKKYRF